MRSLGGSWEQWEDDLTMARMSAIMKAEEEIPPLYVTGYLVAVSLGAMKPPSDTTHDAPQSSGAGFVAAFGEGGKLGGGF